MRKQIYEVVTVIAMLTAMAAAYAYAGFRIGGWRGGVFGLFAVACVACAVSWGRRRLRGDE